MPNPGHSKTEMLALSHQDIRTQDLSHQDIRTEEEEGYDTPRSITVHEGQFFDLPLFLPMFCKHLFY